MNDDGRVTRLKDLIHKLGNALIEIEEIAMTSRGSYYGDMRKIRAKAHDALEMKVKAEGS